MIPTSCGRSATTSGRADTRSTARRRPRASYLATELQPKLLKALETKTFRRLGGTREIQVDVRLIAATNRDIEAAVKSGRFREEMFHRLNVLPLHLPPLRERAREDRLALLKRFHVELRVTLPGSPEEISSEAIERMMNYGWPGNIREMRNLAHSEAPRRQPDPPGGRARHLARDAHQQDQDVRTGPLR